jgi:hypothetical protein
MMTGHPLLDHWKEAGVKRPKTKKPVFGPFIVGVGNDAISLAPNSRDPKW